MSDEYRPARIAFKFVGDMAREIVASWLLLITIRILPDEDYNNRLIQAVRSWCDESEADIERRSRHIRAELR